MILGKWASQQGDGEQQMCIFIQALRARTCCSTHALFLMFTTTIMIIAATHITAASLGGNVDAEFASLYKEAYKPCGKPFCDLFPCYQQHEGKQTEIFQF